MHKKAVCLMMAACVAMLAASCGAAKKVSQATADDAVEIKSVPCSECKSTRDIIRSRGMRESIDQQIAMEMARTSALEDMSSKIGVSVTALIKNYALQRDVNKNMELEQRYERISDQLVDQTVQGYRTICEKYTLSTRPDGTKVYKCYYAIELDKEDAVRSLYKGLTKDDKIHLEYDYDKFKEEFEKELNRADSNR
ncbi:MAG: hypothetical protein IKM79_00130 [Bacteroidales bacterium]|nr:hypothetical protein [Bacteroidales bacterium]